MAEDLADGLGDREDELAHRDVGEDVVYEMGGGLGHALGISAKPQECAEDEDPDSEPEAGLEQARFGETC